MVYEPGFHTAVPHEAPDVTQRYIQRSNDFSTNLGRKFDSKTKLGGQNIVLVALQRKLESQVEFYVSHSCSDFSTPEKEYGNLRALKFKIRDVSKKLYSLKFEIRAKNPFNVLQGLGNCIWYTRNL